jgi:hypothetical protein
MADGPTDGETTYRAKLGSYLVIGSSAGVLLLGVTVIVAAGFKGGANDIKESAQIIFTAVLPLLGTWVGTVLAFYYSKENFESANRGTLDILRSVSQRLSSTRVAEKMMRADVVIKAVVPAGKQIDDLAAKDVAKLFESVGANGQKISRLLLVDATGACIGILHRSVWMEMVIAGGKQQPPFNDGTDNLAKLLPLPYQSKAGATFKDFITKTVAYVAETATLADAKAAMEATPHCQDVMVTATGKNGAPMLGWISNIDIARLSQA